MARLSDIPQSQLRYSIGSAVAGNAAFAAGTGAGTVKTTNAITYNINGVTYSKAATDNIAITAGITTGPVNATTTTYVQPLSVTVYYVFCLDSSGTVSVVQGSYAGQVLGNGAIGDGQIPDVGSTVCPIGILKINSSTATYTLGQALALTSGNFGTVTFFTIGGVIPVGNI